MNTKFKPLILIIILHFVWGSNVCAQQYYDKYYTKVIFTDFLSDSRLDKRLEAEEIDLDLLNAAIFHRTNLERSIANLPLFEFYDNLYLSALLHSESMIKYDFFDHINRHERNWRMPSDRVLHFDSSYITLAENIVENNLLDYRGDVLTYRLEYDENGISIYVDADGLELKYSTYRDLASRLVVQWMKSKPHRENILNDTYELLGCSCAIDSKKQPILIRCTQNFGSFE